MPPSCGTQSSKTGHEAGTIFVPLSLISGEETAQGTQVRLQEGLPGVGNMR